MYNTEFRKHVLPKLQSEAIEVGQLLMDLVPADADAVLVLELLE